MRGIPTAGLFAFVVVLSGCAHDVVLKQGAYQATFYGDRIDPPQVETEKLGEHTCPMTLESSTFVYELTPPFQSFQQVASFVPETTAFELNWDGVQFSSVIAQLISGLRRLPGYEKLACGDGRPDLAGGWTLECLARRDDVQSHLRVRGLNGPRGVVFQTATWVTDKGRSWVDSFWSSLKPVSAVPSLAVASDTRTLGLVATDTVSSKLTLLQSRVP